MMMSMAVTMHPIWQSGAAILGLLVAGALLLQVLVHRFLPADLRRKHIVLGAAIFAVIGTTYAVLLAFMATTAWEQYSTAEALARREANLIGTINSVSYGFPDAVGAAVRHDAAVYLTQVIQAEWPAQIAGGAVPPVSPVLEHLNGVVFAIVPVNLAQSHVQSMLISAVSDVASLRRDRRLAAHGTIPGLVWIVLLSGGALMVGFSFVLGAPTPGLHLLMTAALVASGALVLLLIVGLSSPFQGSVTISPDAYAAVLEEMRGGG